MPIQAMPRSIWVGGIVLTRVVVGCATIDELAPPVDEVMLSTAELNDQSLAMLQDGRDLYITRCARCHSPESVTAYTPEQWSTILPRMAEKAGLSVEERLGVKEYIMAVLTVPERPASID